MITRRNVLGGIALGCGSLALSLHGARAAVISPDWALWEALIEVPGGGRADDVAAYLLPRDPELRSHYVQAAHQLAPDLTGRRQAFEVVSTMRRRESTSAAQVGAVEPAWLPLAAIAGRALLAAARRYGPSVLRGLKNAVQRGYPAFEQWVKDHPFAGGVLAGVSGSAVYEWLSNNL